MRRAVFPAPLLLFLSFTFVLSSQSQTVPPSQPQIPTLASSAIDLTGSREFIVFWHVNHITPRLVEDTCIIVYPSGLYHMERSQQAYGQLEVRAYENTLGNIDLGGLHSLLDEPQLKSSMHRFSTEGKAFRERVLTTLDVPREGHIQELIFADYFGAPVWLSDLNSGYDPEESIVSPVRKWLEAHVKARKKVPLLNGVPSHCLPR